MRTLAAIATAAVVILVAGCGTEKIEGTDAVLLGASLRMVEATCEPRNDFVEIEQAARDNPDAELDGRSMRQILADLATKVAPCNQQFADQIDRVRETLR